MNIKQTNKEQHKGGTLSFSSVLRNTSIALLQFWATVVHF